MRKQRKRPNGRPCYFSEWLSERIFLLARYGMTDDQIAWSLGFGVASLHRWKSSAVFRKKLQAAKMAADAAIEQALHKRARGMTVVEKTVSRTWIKNGVMTNEVLAEREIPPDPGMIKMWLFNRQPDRWRTNHPIPTQDSLTLSAIEALPEVEQSETAKRVTQAIMQIICGEAEQKTSSLVPNQ